MLKVFCLYALQQLSLCFKHLLSSQLSFFDLVFVCLVVAES
jgi:hypothetical protein